MGCICWIKRCKQVCIFNFVWKSVLFTKCPGFSIHSSASFVRLLVRTFWNVPNINFAKKIKFQLSSVQTVGTTTVVLCATLAVYLLYSKPSDRRNKVPYHHQKKFCEYDTLPWIVETMTEAEEMSNSRDKKGGSGNSSTGSTNNNRNKNCETSNMEREMLKTHQFCRQQYCIHHKNDQAPYFDPVP